MDFRRARVILVQQKAVQPRAERRREFSQYDVMIIVDNTQVNVSVWKDHVGVTANTDDDLAHLWRRRGSPFLEL